MPFVYIMASAGGVLYIGVTNDVERRAGEHWYGMGSDFTARYKCHKLVYAEQFPDMDSAIHREKQLKGWKRIRKKTLIDAINPGWRDLANRTI